MSEAPEWFRAFVNEVIESHDDGSLKEVDQAFELYMKHWHGAFVKREMVVEVASRMHDIGRDGVDESVEEALNLINEVDRRLGI